MNLADDGCY